MTSPPSRREFLKSVGLATSTLGLGRAALAQEKSQPQKDANDSGSQPQKFLCELMICDYVQFKLSRVDTHGKVIWEHRPEGKVWDFVLTDDNKLIYPIITDKQEVRCIDLEKNVKWSWPYASEFKEIINITGNHSQLIVSGQQPPEAILMDLNGTIQKRLPIPARYKHHHGQLGNVYAVGNKHYLAQLWGEGTALEVDGNGNEVWRYQLSKFGNGPYPAGTVQDLLRLDNGNTLLACGTQARLLEVDRSGKVVWEFTGSNYPELNLTNVCNLQELRDGSILVTNFLRGNSGRGAHAFTLSKDKQITWIFTDHRNFTATSQVWAIESGKELAGEQEDDAKESGVE
jgi:outer membrane protein assembly factor BamB